MTTFITLMRNHILTTKLTSHQVALGSLFFIALMASSTLSAQPARRRNQAATTTTAPAVNGARAKKATSEKTVDRAALQFPTSAEMPEEVVWRRDIYRQLDLTNDKNAPLYYPVEPSGKNQNLFTYMFRLMLSGRIQAYQYKLDGNESFEDKDKVDVKELLERYYIFYEEKDGKVTVAASDIPSAEVTRYYIKETSYFDQRSATYRSRVTAMCPVLMRGADDFGSEATPYPLFWVKYEDIAPYLSKMPMMASNLNNVTTMTADDYFTLNRYEGKIYKTNNLQGKLLSNYCKTDSAMNKEQKRIEQELTDFESGIWTHQEKPDTTSQQEVTTTSTKKSRKAKAASTSRRSKQAEAASKGSRSSSSSPRVSARRQRR